jgi:diacylglycerol kinase (ATP)
MVHLGAQAVAGTGTPLGVVAVGTGNDFATGVGLPVRAPGAACAALLAALAAGPAGVRHVDAVRVAGAGLSGRARPAGHPDHPHSDPHGGQAVRWVAGAVSAGLDAAVNARANAMVRPAGSSRYVLAALAEIAGYRAWHYRLRFEHVQADAAALAHLLTLPGMSWPGPEADGDGHRLVWQSTGALVTAANGARLGGGIPVAPHAVLDDGLLDVVLAGDVGRAGASVLFPRILAGGHHLGHRLVRVVRARAVTIEPVDDDHRPAAFGDGEHLGTLPLRAEVVPGALKVLVPPVG